MRSLVKSVWFLFHNLLLGHNKNILKPRTLLALGGGIMHCKLTNCRFRINYKTNNSINIGQDCILKGVSFFLDDRGKIEIGDGTTINASKANPVCLNACEGKKIVIGKDCMFSNNIQIHTTDYHSIVDTDSRRSNKAADVILEDHVWVGLNILILKGVRIPNGCILGASSTVLSKFEEPNCLIAGYPAKIIKRNVFWDRRRL